MFCTSQARAKLAELNTDSSLSEPSGSDSDAVPEGSGETRSQNRARGGASVGKVTTLRLPPAKRLRLDNLLLQVEREGLELAGESVCDSGTTDTI